MITESQGCPLLCLQENAKSCRAVRASVPSTLQYIVYLFLQEISG